KIIAMATVTASREATAFPNLSFSKKRAKGNKDMAMRVAKSIGISMLCATYINPKINANANKLEANCREYGLFDGFTSIKLRLVLIYFSISLPIINIQ